MTTTLVLAVSAFAADVDFTCSPDEGAGIVGVAPLEIRCVVEPPAEGTYEAASWTFGEGTLVTGDEVSFVYEDEGQYTVSVQLDGYEGPDAEESDPYHAEYGFVTVCGEPEPRFDFVNKGELDFEFVNETVVAVNCIDSVRWEMWEGRNTDREPKFVFDSWAPRLTLPREGQWTVRLSASGLGGTGSIERGVDVRHKLTDDLTEGPKAYWCATTPWGGGAWLALAALVTLRRRKR